MLTAWITRLIELRCGLGHSPLLRWWVLAVAAWLVFSLTTAGLLAAGLLETGSGSAPPRNESLALVVGRSVATLSHLAAMLLGILVLWRMRRALRHISGPANP